MAAIRDENGKFVKGSVANPGGRPKGVTARAKEACEKHGVDPLDYMACLLADETASTKDRFAAAKELADRLYGKAIQQTENVNTNLETKIQLEFIKPEDEN